MNLGRKLASGFGMDFSQATRHPLQFALSENPVLNDDPRSFVDAVGAVTNAYEWGLEVGDAFVDKRGKAGAGHRVTYIFPVNDSVWLYGYCMSPFVDPIVAALKSREYGAAFEGLARAQLPTTIQMLEWGVEFENHVGMMHSRQIRLGGCSPSSSPPVRRPHSTSRARTWTRSGRSRPR